MWFQVDMFELHHVPTYKAFAALELDYVKGKHTVMGFCRCLQRLCIYNHRSLRLDFAEWD